MRRFPSLYIAVAFALAAACGGASQSDLLDPGAARGDQDAGGTVDSASPDAGGKDAAGKKDTGDSFDSGEHDVGPPDEGVDTAPQGEPEVACSKGQTPAYCAVPAQFCCVPQGGGTYKCETLGAQCQGASVHCDDTADCPGMVCCGTLNEPNGQNPFYSEVTCRTDCMGQTQTTADVQFCDPNKNDCLQGNCMASQLLPGYFVCR